MRRSTRNEPDPRSALSGSGGAVVREEGTLAALGTERDTASGAARERGRAAGSTIRTHSVDGDRPFTRAVFRLGGRL